MHNWRERERIFSNRQFGMTVYIKDINDNGARKVNVATSDNLVVTSTVFPHLNFR